jgi:predicted enzyme related to lactoylglutathione lyase
MSERTSYPNGVPLWVDVATPDIDASAAFYSGLFGWEFGGAHPEIPYGMFLLDGKLVAGVGALQDPNQPPVWATYIAADDADATIAAAVAAGAQVMVPAMDILDSGRMAMLIDPAGAVVGLWQSREHKGAQLVNEPGALGWNELTCRDPAAATAFYTSVFGWEPQTMDMGGGIDYTIFSLGDGRVAGLMPMDDNWPEGVPSHWMVYFVVADADASATLATELGGSVSVPAFDTGVGRVVMLNDPHGAAFSVIALAGPGG